MDRAEREKAEAKRAKKIGLVRIKVCEDRSEQTEVRDCPAFDAVLIESSLCPVLTGQRLILILSFGE